MSSAENWIFFIINDALMFALGCFVGAMAFKNQRVR